MLGGIYCMRDNLHRAPERLMWYAASQAAAHDRVDRLPTSNARRGIRQGALYGGSAGTLCAHALALPFDELTGHGPWLTQAWLQQRRASLDASVAASTPAAGCPHALYGAPQGLLGPPMAFAVGFASGFTGMACWGVGTLAGLIQMPWLLARGDASTSLNSSIARWGDVAGDAGRNLGIAMASLGAAIIADALCLPAMALKVALPTAGIALGAAFGAVAGLRDCWRDGLGEAVLQMGTAGEQNSRDCLVVLAFVAFLGRRARPTGVLR